MKTKITGIWITRSKKSDLDANQVMITFWRGSISGQYYRSSFNDNSISSASVKRAERVYKKIRAQNKARKAGKQ